MSFLGCALALAALVATSGCGMIASQGGNGSGQSASQLTASSTSVSFGKVAVGSPASQTVTLKDMGPGNIKISGLAVMGAGFTMASGGPTTLTDGQSITVSVDFTPKVAGAAQGTLSVLSDAANATIDVALAGTGVTASSQLQASSTSVSFGNVTVGSPASQSVTLKDMGPGNVTISGLAVTGAGFTMTSGAPGTLTTGQSITVSVNFTPKVAGVAQGTLSVLSDAANSTMDVALAGTGITGLSSQLQASATSLSFGNLAVGNSISQPIKLTDVGTANISITNVSPVGHGFSASGGSNVTLVPHQSVTVTVKFAPTVTGSVSGSLSISSNASNSVLTVGLSGNAVAQSVTHHVALNWQPSASSVIGYYVYRGSSANALSKLTGSIDSSPSYTDMNVANGQTYFYAVTSVDANNIESSPSNQVSVTIPN